MGTAVGIPLEEYLTHTYHPDREYVDGELVERNVGEYFHSLLQLLIGHCLEVQREKTGILFRTLPEQRMRVREGFDTQRRYRIPDVMVLPPGYRKTGVTLDPPVLTIEILSPDDRLKDLVSKSQEYVEFGVALVIIADPYARRVYRVFSHGAEEIVNQQVEFMIEGTTIAIDFALLFAELDRD